MGRNFTKNILSPYNCMIPYFQEFKWPKLYRVKEGLIIFGNNLGISATGLTKVARCALGDQKTYSSLVMNLFFCVFYWKICSAPNIRDNHYFLLLVNQGLRTTNKAFFSLKPHCASIRKKSKSQNLSKYFSNQALISQYGNRPFNLLYNSTSGGFFFN